VETTVDRCDYLLYSNLLSLDLTTSKDDSLIKLLKARKVSLENKLPKF
jgi:hypothetical protein